jgi:hypothetical protein
MLLLQNVYYNEATEAEFEISGTSSAAFVTSPYNRSKYENLADLWLS